jgi:hypothetical protein
MGFELDIEIDGKQKQTTKPIFIVGFPKRYDYETYSTFRDDIKCKMKDYHIIIFEINSEEPTFQCFYEKDFNEVKYKELKEIVKNLK